MSQINTLKIYKEMVRNGADDKQAEAYAGALFDSMSGMASKLDLDNLEKRFSIHFTYIHLIEVAIFIGIIGIFIQGLYR